MARPSSIVLNAKRTKHLWVVLEEGRVKSDGIIDAFRANHLADRVHRQSGTADIHGSHAESCRLDRTNGGAASNVLPYDEFLQKKREERMEFGKLTVRSIKCYKEKNKKKTARSIKCWKEKNRWSSFNKILEREKQIMVYPNNQLVQ